MKTAISAHNGFTAKIVSQMQFDYIWASSLEISSSFALPDASIVSFHLTKQVVESMIRASYKPVIVDCDSGYGNAINTYFALSELKAVGVKGVCLEDNVFPKQNSFYKGKRAIETAKHIFNEQDEFVIARTEALINDYGINEALKRGKEYIEAGADLVMPHSKKDTHDELFDFSKQWKSSVPLVAVPSTYYKIKKQELFANKVGLVIYANHTLRTIKKALETTIPLIYQHDSSEIIEPMISPIQEILDLCGQPLVKELESKFVR